MTAPTTSSADYAGIRQAGVSESTGKPVYLSREAKRVPKFDGVRGISAIALLVVHVAFVASLIGSYTTPPSNLFGAAFVDSFQLFLGNFFLISGMFLFRPFARAIIGDTPKPKLGQYFFRRGLRLLPAYYAMVTGGLLLLNYGQIGGIWNAVRPYVLMQNYDPHWMAGMDITWTVPTEIQWYLFLPVAAWAMRRYARRGRDPLHRARRLLLLSPVLFLVGFGWYAYIHLPFMGLYPPQYWWPPIMAGNVGIGMGLGVMSALSQVSPGDTPRLFRLAARRPNMFWLAAAGVFALNSFTPFDRPGYGDYLTMPAELTFYTLQILFAALIITPMIAPGARSRLIEAVFGNRVIVFLGRISYAVYLWHFVILYLVLRNGSIFGTTPKLLPGLRGLEGFWVLEPAVLAGSIAVATLSYYLVERPILRLGDRILKARAERAIVNVSTVPTPVNVSTVPAPEPETVPSA